MAYVLGIDIGTQSVKTGLLDVESGDLMHIASCGYASGSRQSPDEIWNACLDAIAETVNSCGNPSDIRGVGLSGQMHGTVMYDAGGNVLGDIINWQDESCNEPLERYGGRTTIERMIELMGDGTVDLGIDRMSSGFMGATLFFIMENDPVLFGKVKHVLFPTDFVRRRLCGGGDFATDATNAFSSGVFNTREGKWHDGIMARLGLPSDIFPPLKGTGETAGNICADIAERTGLAAGTPVVTGGGDNQMAMIGSGATSPGSPLCVNIGTGSQLCAVVSSYRKIDGTDTRSFIGGNFALVYAGLTGGKCFTWFRNTVLDDISRLCAAAPSGCNVFEQLDLYAKKIPAGCNGLTFTPTLRGTRRNPAARGAFTGIDEGNFTLGHRARAVMEGVVGELLDSYTLMGAQGSAAVVGAGNGLVRSSVWQQITADCFGLPLLVADMENAVYGAAAVASDGLGLMKLEDIKIKYNKTVLPSKNTA